MLEKTFCLFSLPERGKRLIWEITSMCNMNCKHCCAQATRKVANEFISCEESLVKKRIREMIVFGIKEFYISGGEPFIINNILPILSYIKEQHGVKVSIATNGYLLKESLIKKLLEIKIDLLHISLDGYSSKIHNFFRGGEFFDRIISNIKILRKYNLPIRIGCIVWSGIENELERMVRLAVGLEIEELRFSWLIKTGRAKENFSIYPKQDKNSIGQKIEDLKIRYKDQIKISAHRFPALNSCGEEKTLCAGGDKFLFLNSQGMVSPCSWIAKSDGNFLTKKSLRKNSFKSLVNSSRVISFKKMLLARRQKGFTGCPFAAKLCNKDYLSQDSLNCI